METRQTNKPKINEKEPKFLVIREGEREGEGEVEWGGKSFHLIPG